MNKNYLLKILDLLQLENFSQLEALMNNNYLKFNKGMLFILVRHEELFENAISFIRKDLADLRRIILFATLSNASKRDAVSIALYDEVINEVCAVKTVKSFYSRMIIEAFFDLHHSENKKLKSVGNRIAREYEGVFCVSDAFEVFVTKAREAETVKIVYGFCKIVRWQNMEDTTILMSRLLNAKNLSTTILGKRREADALLAKYGLVMISKTTNFNGAFPSLFDKKWRESAKMIMQAVKNGDIPKHLLASNVTDRLEVAMSPRRVRRLLLRHNLID